MQFIAYLAFNNNGDIASALGGSRDYNAVLPVSYPREDVALIKNEAHDMFDINMAYFINLQRLLKQEYGHGFSVAVARSSDCSSSGEILRFCQQMKNLDASIVTIADQGAKALKTDHLVSADLVSEWKRQQYKSRDVLTPEHVPLVSGVDYVVSFAAKRNTWDIGADQVLDVLGQHKALLAKATNSGVIRQLVQQAYEEAQARPAGDLTLIP